MIKDLQKAIEDGKVIIGTKMSIKAIRNGKVKEVYLSSNVPSEVVETIERYAKIANVKVTILKKDNIAFGALCKKPFSINVLSY